MINRIRIAVIVCLAASTSIFPSIKGDALPTGNVEEKVNGEGPRLGAEQNNADISSQFAVWWDGRGTTATVTGTSIWYKDLNSRTESRILELATRQSYPRVSGEWVVWEDAPGGNIDIFARQLPDGPIVRVTDHPAAQDQPSIDGTTVVFRDARNATTTGHDLYMKDVTDPGAPATPVVIAPGDQELPEISGNLVAWTDRRNEDDPHVRVTDTVGATETVIDPGGTNSLGLSNTAFDAAISGTRMVWSHGNEFGVCDADSCSRDLKVRTCELPCTTSATVWDTDDPEGQSQPDVSGNDVIWSEGGDVMLRDVSTADLAEALDPEFNACCGQATPRIDGSLAVWRRQPESGGGDIIWTNLSTNGPLERANSLGMGFFPDQIFPSAGATFTVFHADSNSADAVSLNNVWATDLRGDRRNFRVSSFDFQGDGGADITAAGVGTPVSRPRISGNRVAWSDRRNISDVTGTDVFFRDLDPLGGETPVTETVGIGNTPDIDGDRIVWLCSPEELCVHEGGTISKHTLPVTPPLIVDNLPVRIDGDVVVWSQADLEAPCCGPVTSTLHAIDITSGENATLGSGSSMPKYMGGYDISGSTVVWVGLDGDIYRNSVSFPCAPSCDISASATVFSTNTAFEPSGFSMDGTIVAWGERSMVDFASHIFVQDLFESVPSQLTDEVDESDPFVFGDYVYWTDFRNMGLGTDIFRESLSGGATLTIDTAAPGPVMELAASTASTTITVSWTNPADTDVAGVILMRKTGLSAATGVDDPTAALVFDGDVTTTFVDTDVADGVSYTYTAFPYDEVPNYGSGAAASAGGPTPSISISDVSIAEGDSGTTSASLILSLSASTGNTVEVGFVTANGTATDGSDFNGVSGTVTFGPGVTTQTVLVEVNGDTFDEPDETALVNLNSSVNATVSDSQGVVTILDDDPTPEEQSTSTVTSDSGGSTPPGDPSPSDPVDAQVDVPPGSASGDTTIIIEEFAADDPALPPDPSGFSFGGQVISVHTDPPVTFTATNPATLVLSYDQSIVPAHQDEATMEVFHSDGGGWVAVGEPCSGGDGSTPISPDPCIAVRDTEANTVTIRTTDFSFFGFGFPPPPPPPPPPAPGYWMVASDGGIFAFGSAGFYGSTGGISLNQPVVGMASTPSGAGYWLVASDGGIFAFGDAGFHGSTGAIRLNQPIVGMASTKSGNGYWLVASDGGIFAFGDAGFHGSTGAIALNRPIVGMASTKSGNGYWLVASDGGIFAFGDAAFYGSTGAIALNQPIVGMSPTKSGGGYWMVASDGGIFAFGDAPFYGSTGAIQLNRPIVGMAATPSGAGYWVVASDGGIFAFGDAAFLGSTGGIQLNRPVVGMASSTN